MTIRKAKIAASISTAASNQTLFRHLNRFQQSADLVKRFLILHFRHAVGDDVGTGLDVGVIALDDEGPEGGASIHVAALVDIEKSKGTGEVKGRSQRGQVRMALS